MKSLFKKIRGNKKGFTLAELLVVVAIVGILVAISIPVFTAQLGKARKATNEANLRAAKAAAVAYYLTDDNNGVTAKEGGKYTYNIQDGTVQTYTGTLNADKKKEIGSADSNAVYTHIWVEITDAAGDAVGSTAVYADAE
ncbi:type IV pilin protein [Candidatus Ventrimonas sp.]|uniref:type IV pilin protein n=1 Tax=Candidatus Ventrimonas sp. TaxID=3048889 RepID=UPI003AB8708D